MASKKKSFVYRLLGDTVKFVSEWGKATFASMQFNQAILRGRKALNDYTKRALQLSAVASAAIVALYGQQSKSIDDLAKTADKLGVPVQGLQNMRQAAKLTGVETNKLDMGIQRMVRRISEAAHGTGEAKDALAELNLDARKLNELAPDQQFREIAKAMEGVTNQGDRVRLAMRLFDSEGVALVNTLALGAEGLDQVSQELDELGAHITRLDAAKIEEANDQFTRGSEAIGAFSRNIAIEAAPIVGEFGEMFLESAKEAGGLDKVARNVMTNVAGGAGHVANVFRGWHVVLKGLELGFQSLLAVGLLIFTKLGQGIEDSINFSTSKINGLIDSVNSLPGLDIAQITPTNFESVDALKLALKDALVVADNTRAELANLAAQPMPAESIRQWIDNVYAEAEQQAINRVGESGGLAHKLLGDVEVAATQSSQREIDALKELEEFKLKSYDRQLDILGGFMGSQASILQQGFGKRNAITRAAFLAEKAMAIPSMIVATEQGAAKALALGPIAGPIMATLIRGLGYASIGVAAAQAIKGQAHKGMTSVPGDGSFNIMRGERIVATKQNEDLTRFLASAGKGQGGGNIYIYENGNDRAAVEQDGDDTIITLERIEEHLGSRVRQGRGLGPIFEGTYGVSRKGFG